MYDVLVLTTWRNREKEINHGAPLMLILAEACHPREPEEVTEPFSGFVCRHGSQASANCSWRCIWERSAALLLGFSSAGADWL